MYQACGHFVNPDMEFSDLGGGGSSFPGWWGLGSQVCGELDHTVIPHAKAGLVLSVILEGHTPSSLQPKEP